MKILVLGGCGFIGSQVVAALHARGHVLVNYDRTELRQRKRAGAGLIHLQAEFGNRGELESAVADHKPDVVVHLVWSTLPKSSNDDPCFDVRSNLEDSIYLFSLCVRFNIRKLIFMSSGGTVYGVPQYLPIDEAHPTNPISSYGITKLAAEKYVALYHRLHGLQYVCLRAANPYGPGQSPTSSQGAIAVFAHCILQDLPIALWGDGEIVRDFFCVTDLAMLVVRAVESDAVGTFNAGSGTGTSLNEVIRTLSALCGKTAIINPRPARQFDPAAIVLDSKAARRTFDWQPEVSLAEGLRGVLDSLRTTAQSGTRRPAGRW